MMMASQMHVLVIKKIFATLVDSHKSVIYYALDAWGPLFVFAITSLNFYRKNPVPKI